MTSAENYSENERKTVVVGEVKVHPSTGTMGRVSAVSPQNRRGFLYNSVGLNRGGYRQNTELTTGCDTAKGISMKWRQKAERSIGVLPCSRLAERKGTKGKKERTRLIGKADGSFLRMAGFTKGYGAAKRERLM